MASLKTGIAAKLVPAKLEALEHGHVYVVEAKKQRRFPKLGRTLHHGLPRDRIRTHKILRTEAIQALWGRIQLVPKEVKGIWEIHQTPRPQTRKPAKSKTPRK